MVYPHNTTRPWLFSSPGPAVDSIERRASNLIEGMNASYALNE